MNDGESNQPPPERELDREAQLIRHIEALRRERDGLEVEVRRVRSEHRGRERELEQLVSMLSVTLASTKRDIERAAESRAWRYGHAVTRTARRLLLRRDRTDGALAAALRRIDELQRATHALPSTDVAPPPSVRARTSAGEPAAEPPPPPRSRDEIAAQRALLAVEIRERLGPFPKLETWPPVSLVVVNRNGAEHLRNLFDGLSQRTDYPEFEVIIVDNASSDGSLTLLTGTGEPFPISVVANNENVSYSQANMQGAARASHELLLFLNNDVEPFETGWLRELVAAHVQGGHAAIGATLLLGEQLRQSGANGRLVQHRGIKLRADLDGVRPYNDGAAEDIFDGRFGIEERVPAATGACLLLPRSTLDAAGGFPAGYRYGSEDVDLGLTLTRAGLHLAVTGRALLYHHESSTQDVEGSDFKRVNRTLNRRILLERHGPSMRRAYRLARLERDAFWTDGHGPHVAVTVTSSDPAAGWGDWYTAHELGDALAELGWQVSYIARKRDGWYALPDRLDYVITLMDPFDVRTVPADIPVIAWIRNWTERWLKRPWFDRIDVLMASSAASAKLIEEATGRTATLFPLATNPKRFVATAADPERAVDCVFTGNYWGRERAIQPALRNGSGPSLALYGRDWDQVPEVARAYRGTVPYDELPTIYASAKLVLDDTQGPTLPYAALNARVFDALATGTLPLTNCVEGVRELFDADFPTWDSPEALRRQIEELVADEQRRTRLARKYQAQVLKRHTYDHRARRLVEVLREHEEKPSFCIKVGAPDWVQAERWGDLHFARAIARELQRHGHRSLIQVLEEWEDPRGLTYDVVLHLKGLSRHHPKPGQFNILWCISHPDELTGEECDGYDLVFVASATFAENLRARTSTPVEVLEQATDPRVFYPDPDPNPTRHHELVYVANSRNVLRPIVRDLLPTEHDLAIYGANWEGLVDQRYVVADHVPNDELRRVYSSAAIVLCDHWDDMREYGFIANRIYDAAACGAFVISDDVPGITERFGDTVVTYRNTHELRRLVARFLADPVERIARANRARLIALEHHTFDQRIRVSISALSRYSIARIKAQG